MRETPRQLPRQYQTSPPRRSRVGMDPPARAKSDPTRRPGLARMSPRLPDLLPVSPRREPAQSNEVGAAGRASVLPAHKTAKDALREALPGHGYLSTWKGNLMLSEDKSWFLNPARARNEDPVPHSARETDDTRPSNVLLDHLTLGEEHVIGLLRKLEWFRLLPEKDLKTLYRRGRLRAFPRYSAIIREGSSCHAVHILLHGQLQCVSASKSTTVINNVGAYFGESTLVTQEAQEMDASVYAEGHCCG